jgi:chemotaxis signal transduction protein
VSAPAAEPGAPDSPRQPDRLLTFEVGGAVYAIPISGVLEVVEAGELACIPTLPLRVAGVINHHGDALPVVHCASLLELDASQGGEPAHVLVIGERGSSAASLGLPVDRVRGLVDGGASPARGAHPVAERSTVAGRVANIIDPQRLVARAREVIERSVAPR